MGGSRDSHGPSRRRERQAAEKLTRAHNTRDLALLDAGLERWQVRVDEVLLRHKDVNVVAVRAVPAVQLIRDKVLAARAGLQRVGGLRRVLEALHKVGGVLPRDKRILSRRLNIPSPSRVAHDVDLEKGRGGAGCCVRLA